MTLPLFIVDAFASRPFTGNPAAITLLDRAADEAWMKRVAAEMNLSETAFVVARADGAFDLRWFTPEVEVPLCGHATLASAHVLWESKRLGASAEARFHTKSGVLGAVREGESIALDFPARASTESAPPAGLFDALGVRGAQVAWVGRFADNVLVMLHDEAAVRALAPDFARLRAVDARAAVVTARGSGDFDFVSRFFGPNVGIDEVSGDGLLARRARAVLERAPRQDGDDRVPGVEARRRRRRAARGGAREARRARRHNCPRRAPRVGARRVSPAPHAVRAHSARGSIDPRRSTPRVEARTRFVRRGCGLCGRVAFCARSGASSRAGTSLANASRMPAASPPRPALSVPRPGPSKSLARNATAARAPSKSEPRLSLHSVDLEVIDGDRTSDVGVRSGAMQGRATMIDAQDQIDPLDFVLDSLRDVTCERAVEAASVCLATLAHAVGCRGALAHLWDAREQNFVVVYVLALNAGMVLNSRHGADDRLFAGAFAKRSPRVVNFQDTGDAPLPRHAVIPGAWSVLVAPVMEQDVSLGVLELVDPLDGSCFDDRAVAAAHYCAERLADLLRDACSSIGKVVVAEEEGA